MHPCGPAGDNDAVQAGQSPKTAIDWQQVGEEILCPLCYYNLRGLIEPRCPECGYRFEWSNLLAPENRRHPYLFEHHPNRKPWSFYRTLLGGLRPREFWSTLKPSQPSRAALLGLYWVIGHALIILTMVGLLSLAAMDCAQRMNQLRVSVVQTWSASPAPNPWRQSYPSRQTLDQHLDQVFPLPPSWEFFGVLIAKLPNSRLGALVVVPGGLLAGLFLVWPWLTFLTLMIFRVSMRRARVRTIHVLRCVVYSSDAALWLWILAAGLGTLRLLLISQWLADLLWVVAMAYVTVFMYRVTIAYSRYLKFDHSFLTILAAQMIVLLLVLTTVFVAGDLYNLFP